MEKLYYIIDNNKIHKGRVTFHDNGKCTFTSDNFQIVIDSNILFDEYNDALIILLKRNIESEVFILNMSKDSYTKMSVKGENQFVIKAKYVYFTDGRILKEKISEYVFLSEEDAKAAIINNEEPKETSVQSQTEYDEKNPKYIVLEKENNLIVKGYPEKNPSYNATLINFQVIEIDGKQCEHSSNIAAIPSKEYTKYVFNTLNEAQISILKTKIGDIIYLVNLNSSDINQYLLYDVLDDCLLYKYPGMTFVENKPKKLDSSYYGQIFFNSDDAERYVIRKTLEKIKSNVDENNNLKPIYYVEKDGNVQKLRLSNVDLYTKTLYFKSDTSLVLLTMTTNSVKNIYYSKHEADVAAISFKDMCDIYIVDGDDGSFLKKSKMTGNDGLTVFFTDDIDKEKEFIISKTIQRDDVNNKFFFNEKDAIHAAIEKLTKTIPEKLDAYWGLVPKTYQHIFYYVTPENNMVEIYGIFSKDDELFFRKVDNKMTYVFTEDDIYRIFKNKSDAGRFIVDNRVKELTKLFDDTNYFNPLLGVIYPIHTCVDWTKAIKKEKDMKECKNKDTDKMNIYVIEFNSITDEFFVESYTSTDYTYAQTIAAYRMNDCLEYVFKNKDNAEEYAKYLNNVFDLVKQTRLPKMGDMVWVFNLSTRTISYTKAIVLKSTFYEIVVDVFGGQIKHYSPLDIGRLIFMEEPSKDVATKLTKKLKEGFITNFHKEADDFYNPPTLFTVGITELPALPMLSIPAFVEIAIRGTSFEKMSYCNNFIEDCKKNDTKFFYTEVAANRYKEYICNKLNMINDAIYKHPEIGDTVRYSNPENKTDDISKFDFGTIVKVDHLNAEMYIRKESQNTDECITKHSIAEIGLSVRFSKNKVEEQAKDLADKFDTSVRMKDAVDLFENLVNDGFEIYTWNGKFYITNPNGTMQSSTILPDNTSIDEVYLDEILVNDSVFIIVNNQVKESTSYTLFKNLVKVAYQDSPDNNVYYWADFCKQDLNKKIFSTKEEAERYLTMTKNAPIKKPIDDLRTVCKRGTHLYVIVPETNYPKNWNSEISNRIVSVRPPIVGKTTAELILDEQISCIVTDSMQNQCVIPSIYKITLDDLNKSVFLTEEDAIAYFLKNYHSTNPKDYNY